MKNCRFLCGIVLFPVVMLSQIVVSNSRSYVKNAENVAPVSGHKGVSGVVKVMIYPSPESASSVPKAKKTQNPIDQFSNRRKHLKRVQSPDGRLSAYVETRGSDDDPSTESKIEIRSERGKILKSESYFSKDHSHGMQIFKGEWTSDSRFFVFNGVSSGGHQVGHVPTFFYSREDNQIRLLDSFVGIWVTGDFILNSQDSIRVPVRDRSSDGAFLDSLVKAVRLRDLIKAK